MMRLDALLRAMLRATTEMPASLRAELAAPPASVIRRGRAVEEALLHPLSRALDTDYAWVHPECVLGRRRKPPEAVLLLGGVAQDALRSDLDALRLLARWRAPVKLLLTGAFRDREVAERDWSQVLAAHWRAWPEPEKTRYVFVAPDATSGAPGLACSVMTPVGQLVHPLIPLRDAAERAA